MMHFRKVMDERIARVQDPFGNLFAKATGSALVSHAHVAETEAMHVR